jgi:hypothetical protein
MIGGLEVLHEVKGLLNAVVIEVVDDHVESGFWEELKQWR